MKVQLLKAARDLTSNPKRTLLVLFALVLGIWGAGTVLISWYILMNDLRANYQSTHPAHIIFTSKEFNKLNLGEFSRKAEIEAAELRDFSLHRIEVRPNEWIPLWLYGVENFNDYKLARLFREEGAPVPRLNTIFIERDCRHVSNIKTGSVPRVRIGSTIVSVPVSGICFDPVQAPATQDAFIYAYTYKQSYHNITGLPVNQRLIVRLRNVYSLDDVQKRSRELLREFKTKGIDVLSVDIPKFNEHPHQWQLNTLLFLIGAIGFLALIMGAVLVSQLVKSIMANQIRQMGILKAIGASRFQLFGIYLFMLLLTGALSGLIAIPAAQLSGSAFAGFVAGKLNFNIFTTVFPFRLYLALGLASLFLPALLSLPTLMKGSRISVQEALGDYGISQKAKVREFAFLKKVPISDGMILAIRNAQRNMSRLMVTIYAMAFGVAIFCTGFNVRQSLWELLMAYKDEMRYDVQVVLNHPVSQSEALAPFGKLGNIKKVECWLGGRGEIQSKIVSTSKGAGIVALPANSGLLKLRITKGRWLKPSQDFEVVLNQQAMELYNNPAIGSSINLIIKDKSINARVVGMTQQFERAKIYADIERFDALLNFAHKVNTITFVAQNNDYHAVIALKKNIENVIAPSSMDIAYVVSQAERVKIIYDHLNIILSVLIILSFLVLLVSAVGMASATGINIQERTREIGVMRAIGATPQKIFGLFVCEGLITCIVSILLGLLLSYPLSRLAALFFGNLMLGKDAKLAYAFSTSGFFITLTVTLLFGWLASRIPAKSAITVSVQRSLSYE
jgi:putative ABC transport system permease protein